MDNPKKFKIGEKVLLIKNKMYLLPYEIRSTYKYGKIIAFQQRIHPIAEVVWFNRSGLKLAHGLICNYRLTALKRFYEKKKHHYHPLTAIFK